MDWSWKKGGKDPTLSEETAATIKQMNPARPLVTIPHLLSVIIDPPLLMSESLWTRILSMKVCAASRASCSLLQTENSSPAPGTESRPLIWGRGAGGYKSVGRGVSTRDYSVFQQANIRSERRAEVAGVK